MNTTVIMLLVISILGLLFFLVLHLYNTRKQGSAATQGLAVKRMAARVKIIIGKNEIINNQLIGLDTSKRLLLVSDFEDKEEGLTTIPLSNVAFYKFQTQYHEDVHRGRNRTASEKLLNKISLSIFSTTRNLLFEFVFFDQHKNRFTELPYLMKRAEYWKKIIKRTGAVEIVL